MFRNISGVGSMGEEGCSAPVASSLCLYKDNVMTALTFGFVVSGKKWYCALYVESLQLQLSFSTFVDYFSVYSLVFVFFLSVSESNMDLEK